MAKELIANGILSKDSVEAGIRDDTCSETNLKRYVPTGRYKTHVSAVDIFVVVGSIL